MWQTGDIHGGVRGMTGVPMVAWSSLDTDGGGDVHGGVRGRTWVPMGAWSNKMAGTRWGTFTGENLGADGGV